MANPNAVVTHVLPFPPAGRRVPAGATEGSRRFEIALVDGRRVRLDPADPRSGPRLGLLHDLGERGIPVYLEIDPGQGLVTRVLIPLVVRVVDLRSGADGALEIGLHPSHARHRLAADHPDREELVAALRAAHRSGELVAVTRDDDGTLVDVRAFRPSPDGPDLPVPGLPVRPRFDWRHPLRSLRDLRARLWYWRWWPWWWCWWWRCVSPARAQQLFDAMKATGCPPLTVPAPCIPFLYPEDGCWARAHEMRRLMLALGHGSRKIWIHGALRTPTRNSPQCEVHWGWHVAPTLCVRRWLLFARRLVIDPSLFDTPVTRAVWKGIQGDPSAALTDTHGSLYLFPGTTDPDHSGTSYYLAFYRAQLQNRAISLGPPPYAHCP